MQLVWISLVGFLFGSVVWERAERERAREKKRKKKNRIDHIFRIQAKRIMPSTRVNYLPIKYLNEHSIFRLNQQINILVWFNCGAINELSIWAFCFGFFYRSNEVRSLIHFVGNFFFGLTRDIHIIPSFMW